MTRDDLLQEARSWIGTPYCHQASLKGVGTDCLGLIRGVWRACYGSEPECVPPYSASWTVGSDTDTLTETAERHLIRKSIANRSPGDVLLFKYRPTDSARHCAILSTPDKILHAYARRAVCETALHSWWLRRVSSVYSFPGLQSPHGDLSAPSTSCDRA